MRLVYLQLGLVGGGEGLVVVGVDALHCRHTLPRRSAAIATRVAHHAYS